MIIGLKLWLAHRRVIATLKREEAARTAVAEQRRLLAGLEEIIECLEVEALTVKHLALQERTA